MMITVLTAFVLLSMVGFYSVQMVRERNVMLCDEVRSISSEIKYLKEWQFRMQFAYDIEHAQAVVHLSNSTFYFEGHTSFEGRYVKAHDVLRAITLVRSPFEKMDIIVNENGTWYIA